jgi:hypothetical protein
MSAGHRFRQIRTGFPSQPPIGARFLHSGLKYLPEAQ